MRGPAPALGVPEVGPRGIRGESRDTVVVYLNNILVFLKTLEEYILNVTKVLKYLDKADL